MKHTEQTSVCQHDYLRKSLPRKLKFKSIVEGLSLMRIYLYAEIKKENIGIRLLIITPDKLVCACITQEVMEQEI